MKRGFLFAALLLAAVAFADEERGTKLQDFPLPGSSAATPGPGGVLERRILRAEGEKRGTDLAVKVERIWSEGADTYASLTVRNTSPWEIDEIDVNCTALGPNEKELSVQQRKLAATEKDPIRPGYSTTLRLVLDSAGSQIRALSCSARGF